MKKILIIITIVLFIFQMVVLATTIEIGLPATDRNSYREFPYTIVNVGVTATGTGTITSVEIYALTGNPLADCKVATFFVVSGNNLSTRDWETVDNGNGVGVVLGGSKQTFTVDLDVEAGDYIGLSASAGQLERVVSGEPGVWRYGNEQIPCENLTFTLSADRGFSLYGSGATPAAFALVKFNNVTVTKWNELEILKWNAKEIP